MVCKRAFLKTIGLAGAGMCVHAAAPPQRAGQWKAYTGVETSDVGYLFNDSFDRVAIGDSYTFVNSPTASIESEELKLAETSVSTTRYLLRNDWWSNCENLRLGCTFRITNPGAGTYGIAIGCVVKYGSNGYASQLSTANADKGTVFLLTQALANVATSTSGDSGFSADQLIDLTLEVSGWTYTAKAYNRTTGVTRTASQTMVSSGSPPLSYTRRFALWSIGGTQTVYVDNVYAYSTALKPARLVLIGDSISQGGNTTAQANRFCDLIQSGLTTGHIYNLSSGSNRTTDSLAAVNEIIAYHPRKALLMIGGNDIGVDGDSASTVGARYASLVSSLETSGTTVIHCLATPRGQASIASWNSWIQSNYSAGSIIDTYTPLLGTGYSMNATYSESPGDSVHPNDAGHAVIADTILNSGLL